MLPIFPEDKSGRVINALAPSTNAELDGTSASAASDVFDADDDTIVRVSAVAAVRVLVGTAPTALATSMAMAAGTVEYFRIPANNKIALDNYPLCMAI
jgi:hypothetical protein